MLWRKDARNQSMQTLWNRAIFFLPHTTPKLQYQTFLELQLWILNIRPQLWIFSPLGIRWINALTPCDFNKTTFDYWFNLITEKGSFAKFANMHLLIVTTLPFGWQTCFLISLGVELSMPHVELVLLILRFVGRWIQLLHLWVPSATAPLWNCYTLTQISLAMQRNLTTVLCQDLQTFPHRSCVSWCTRTDVFLLQFNRRAE